MPMDGTITLLIVIGRRHEDHIAHALMRAFGLTLRCALRRGVPQGTLSKHNRPRECFILHEMDTYLST
jgi:hypothetical protein